MGEPPPARRTGQEISGVAVFFWLCVAFAVFSTIVVVVSSTMVLALTPNLANLSGTIGTSNPITLGALLTAFVALVGLQFLIHNDNNFLFGTQAGIDLRRLIFVVQTTGALINLSWELLRTVLNVYESNVGAAVGRFQRTPIAHTVEAGERVVWFKKNVGNGIFYTPVFTFTDYIGAFFSPTFLASWVVTVITIALMSVMAASMNPLPRTLREQKIYHREMLHSARIANKRLGGIAHSYDPSWSCVGKRLCWLPLALELACYLLIGAASLIVFNVPFQMVARFVFSLCAVYVGTNTILYLAVRYYLSNGLAMDKVTYVYFYACVVGLNAALLVLPSLGAHPIGVAVSVFIGMKLIVWHISIHIFATTVKNVGVSPYDSAV